MTLGLGYPNRFDGATLSGQGWTSTLPVSNLGTRQISQVARSHWPAAKFYANFTAAIDARIFGSVGHNLTTTGKKRVRGYSADPRAYVDRSTQVSTCDIDLAGGFPSSLVTCTRSTTANYFDSDLVLRSAAINTPRFTYDQDTGAALGLLVEATVTNQLLKSRDFTNVVWTKTNMTTAQTVTGLDGAANSATRLTATAANATVTQARTPGSQSYVSVYARRVTGSGTVQLTGDNFSTTTTMTLTTSWKRFWIVCTLATATLGIKIVTSGDVIEVDFAQVETGAAVTSPIATTDAPVQRVGDNISISIPSHIRPSSASGSWVAEMRTYGKAASGTTTFFSTTGSAAIAVLHDGSGNLEYSYAGSSAREFGVSAIDQDFTLSVNYANAAHDGRYNNIAATSISNPATTAGTLTGISASPASAGFALRRLTFFSAVQDAGTLNTFSTPFAQPTAGYDSGLVDAWPAAWVSGTTAEQKSGARGTALIDAGATKTYAYWRIEFSDSLNADAYVQLGREFMGSTWLPDHGMLTGASIGYESRSTTTEADDGAEYHAERRGPRVVRFNLEAQTQNEAMLKILEMQRQLGSTGELLFQWDIGDTLYAPARTFLGRLRSLSPLTAINSNLWSASFEVKESL